MILRNFDELIGVAKVKGRRRIAIARAEDDLVLSGLELAYQDGLIQPILVGDGAKIKETVARLGLPEAWPVVSVEGDDRNCALRAVKLVKDGDAELLMKGQMPTASLFSAVLDREQGLPRHGILSHLVFMSIAAYPKLFAATDGGLNRSPDFKQKIEIVRNAIRAFHDLGYECPKVGLLSYIEKVRPDDPETEEWDRISRMAKDGEFGSARVSGPLALDVCLSEEAKAIKHITCEVAADVDAIVAPNITACNASSKALMLSGGTGAGIVVGASVPIVALSRADSPRIRLCSIAAGIALLREKKP